MTNQIRCLCANPALDRSMHIDHVVPDQKLRCGPPRIDPGGGGVNVARAITRLGGPSRVIYLGGGPTGDLIEAALDQEAVEQRRIPVDGHTRESITVLEDATDHQYRFSTPGAQVDQAEWQRCLDAVFDWEAPPAYLVASGSLSPGMPEDFYARVARRARDCRLRLIIDSSGEALRQVVDAGVFLIKPNMRELGHLAGEEIESEAHEREVAQGLVEDGKADVVIVSLGAGGALLVTKERTENVRAPTVNIKSRIGAGDSMVGGISLALAEGRSLREAAYYGVATGSAAVKTPGTELFHPEDVAQLYENMWAEA